MASMQQQPQYLQQPQQYGIQAATGSSVQQQQQQYMMPNAYLLQQQQPQQQLYGGDLGGPLNPTGVQQQQQALSGFSQLPGTLLQPQPQQQQHAYPAAVGAGAPGLLGGTVVGGLHFQPQQQQQQFGVVGGQMQLMPSQPAAPSVRPMVSRRQQLAAADPLQQQQQQYVQQQQQQYTALPQQQQQYTFMPQPQQGFTAATTTAAVLPAQAWSLLPTNVCESLVQILAARPNLAPAVQNLSALSQLSGLSAGAQGRVVSALWSVPVPPVASMAAGLMQMLCGTAGR